MRINELLRYDGSIIRVLDLRDNKALIIDCLKRHIRNEHLLAFSGYCITYCHRTSGGTANTIRKAIEEGLTVYNSSSWDIRQLRRRKD